MPNQLTLAPKPFKSSNLAIPPSPFSPRLPITPPASPPKDVESRTRTQRKLELPPPPTDPLNWLWQCHQCHRVYQLGVTRRCLDDGHYFCAGTTTVKRSKRAPYKKVVKHKACASEFDYQGWKAWGTWRRDLAEQIEAAETLEELLLSNDEPRPLFAPIPPEEGRWLDGTWTKKAFNQRATKDYWTKDCWNACDYPSECRWGKHFGVQTPVVTVTVPSSPPAASSPMEAITEAEVKTSFDDILLDIPGFSTTDQESGDHPESYTQSAIPASVDEVDVDVKKPSMDDLLQSAKRRKRRSAGAPPSPLASNPPSPTSPVAAATPSTAQVLQRAFDDFDLDIRKSFGRAGEAITSLVGSRRTSTAALEDEKAETFVAGLPKAVKKRLGGDGIW